MKNLALHSLDLAGIQTSYSAQDGAGVPWCLTGDLLRLRRGGRRLIGDGGPATSAQLSGPARLAVDTDGTVYISDFNNNAVRVLRPIQ